MLEGCLTLFWNTNEGVGALSLSIFEQCSFQYSCFCNSKKAGSIATSFALNLVVHKL